VPWEDAAEYHALVTALVSERAPQGPTEEHLSRPVALPGSRKRSTKGPPRVFRPIAAREGAMRGNTKKRAKTRRYPVNRIKQSCSYDQNEIAKLFLIHRNTVRHWIKAGLRTIDDRRPLLVHGSALKSFLDTRQQARQHKCAPGEFFCFRCRAPRQPWGNVADAAPHTEKVQKLTALCSVCETTMHRTIRRADIPKLAGLIDIRSMAEERIRDCPDTSANSDFKRGRPDVETERAK
jgi:hypothetical protein